MAKKTRDSSGTIAGSASLGSSHSFPVRRKQPAPVAVPRRFHQRAQPSHLPHRAFGRLWGDLRAALGGELEQRRRRRVGAGRHQSTGRASAVGAAMLAQIIQNIINARLPGTATLPAEFFRVQLPAGFATRSANEDDVTSLQRLKLYRLRQAYTRAIVGAFGCGGGAVRLFAALCAVRREALFLRRRAGPPTPVVAAAVRATGSPLASMIFAIQRLAMSVLRDMARLLVEPASKVALPLLPPPLDGQSTGPSILARRLRRLAIIT